MQYVAGDRVSAVLCVPCENASVLLCVQGDGVSMSAVCTM